jgi:outer membrane protein assembly factor BamE (lipoprotein component of BamABCDE complex)
MRDEARPGKKLAGSFFRPIDRDAGVELGAPRAEMAVMMIQRTASRPKTGQFGIASENIMTNRVLTISGGVLYQAVRFLTITGVVLCCVAAAYYASKKPNLGQSLGATPDASGYDHDYSDATLAEVIPGKTTKAEVEALLGEPWRTTNFAGPHDAPGGHEAPEIWEWRGRDSQNGRYRVHIEFNHNGIVTNIAKVPEKTGTAPARVAADELKLLLLCRAAHTQAKAPDATPQVADNLSAGMFRRLLPAQPQ